jgi:hypothetical protein
VTDTCTARQTDAVGAALDCELPADHEGAHEAHTTPDVTVTWTGGSPPNTDPQAARAHRRHTIRWLLNLASLTPAGHADLRTAVEAEIADADETRDALGTMCAEVRRLSTKLGKARTASDVLVQHDVTRKAMCDALGVGYHLNWQQIIDTAQRSHTANAEWQQESERRRAALSEALGLGTSAPWYAIVDRAATVKTAAYERAELLESARDALSTAGQNGPHADDWPAIAPGIEALAAERDVAVEGERRAMQQRKEMAEERYAWQERGDRAEKRAVLAERALTRAMADWRREARRADTAEAAITRVRDECDRIEQAVRDNPTSPDMQGGYLACLRHVRAALDGTGNAEPEPPPASPCRRDDQHAPHDFEVWGRVFRCPGTEDAAPAEPVPECGGCVACRPPVEPQPEPRPLVINIELNDTELAAAIRRAVQRHPGSPS